ncbi:MAG: PAS domain S-box protein [Steroidobacteraceae bacterium]
MSKPRRGRQAILVGLLGDEYEGGFRRAHRNAMAEKDMLSDACGTHAVWRWNPPWAAGFFLFLVYVTIAAGTLLATTHPVDPSLRLMLVVVPWLADGVGVAGMLLGGARLWPAFFIGSWVVWGVIVGDQLIPVTVGAAAKAGCIVLIVRLLSLWGFHRSFDRFRDPLILLAAATVGQVLAVTLDWWGIFIHAWLAPGSFSPLYRQTLTDASGDFPTLSPAMFSASVHWSLNCIAGIMLVVPLVSATRDGLQKTYLTRPISLLCLGFALLVWSVAALTLPVAATTPLLIIALMLVAWASIPLGPPVAAFATLVMSLVASVGVGFRLGPLAAHSLTEGVTTQWGFIGLLTLTGLSLTALLAERRRDLQQLHALAERYQRLFKSNPSPLWVAEPNDGRILMVNDAAMHLYGFSETEFLAMTVRQLAADTGSVPELAPDTSVARSLRHRTRGEKVIDVELVSTPIELGGHSAVLAVDVTDRLQLRARILATVELERQRLARELHDGLGQVLAGLNLGAEAAAADASRGKIVDGAFAGFLVNASKQAATLYRQLSRGVSPLQDANGDLLEALCRLPNSLPPDSAPRLEVKIDSQAPSSLSLERSEHLYRVVQEAVSNALKHAHATHLHVRVGVTAEKVEVEIEDDGVGIQLAAHSTTGLGLRFMELRAEAVGATLKVGARPGGGTIIRCECPQQEHIEIRDAAQSAVSHPAAEPRPTLLRSSTPAPSIGASALTYVARCLLLAAACLAGFAVSGFIAGITDPRVGMAGTRMAVPALFTGVGLAGLILGGARLWPGIGLAALAGVVVVHHQQWLFAIYYGAVAALTMLIMLKLLSRWGFSRTFDRWQDPLLLIGAAIVGCSLFAALFSIGALAFQWLRPGDLTPAAAALMTRPGGATTTVTAAFVSRLGHWWATGVAGLVVFVPLLVATPSIFRTLRNHHVEAGFWCLALLGWVACTFLLSEGDARCSLVAMALVLLVWAVVRFGVAMAAGAIAVCSMAATVSFATQRGVLATIGVTEGVNALWGFLLLLAGIGLFLTALLAERNRNLRELAATTQRYRRLFAHGPHPLWVQDRATGRILMVNEQAIRRYGYSEHEWLALTIDDLAAKSAGAATIAPIRDYASIETRHRVKSGERIDVELSFAPIDMDGRPTLLCFAVDVTERNALRRGFLEATDLERRRLANELRFGLGRALAQIDLASARIEQTAGITRLDAAAIDLLARASRRASEVCRQTAHSLTHDAGAR